MRKITVGVLGATGLVGQTIVNMLDGHPWFEVTELAASEKSAGKRYEEVMETKWSASPQIPEYARKLSIKECKTNLDCDVVFSALDSSVALEIEGSFAKEGYAVISKAKNYRMEPDVPLLISEINPDHIDLIKTQRKKRGWKGFIVAGPNCSTTGMSMALKPISDKFGIEKVIVTTLQSISGAGYPGVPSMDINGNVLPFINDEEEKMQTEPQKILGKLSGESIKHADFKVSAQCNRVPVSNGHTECISVQLSKKATEKEIIDSFNGFKPLKKLNLPTAPENPIAYLSGQNRPQPKLDVSTGNGMTVSVGRLRKCSILDYKFVTLSHNLIRGAAGDMLLNAELLKVKGYLD